MADISQSLEGQRNSDGCIVEEHVFTKRLQELRISHQTLDGIFEILEPVVLRQPELFPEVPGTNIRRIWIEAGADHPALRIWIEYDGEVVRLIDIEYAEGGR